MDRRLRRGLRHLSNTLLPSGFPNGDDLRIFWVVVGSALKLMSLLIGRIISIKRRPRYGYINGKDGRKLRKPGEFGELGELLREVHRVYLVHLWETFRHDRTRLQSRQTLAEPSIDVSRDARVLLKG